MITRKTEKEIALLREGGQRLAFILNELAKMVHPGITGAELNKRAEELALEGGDKSAFLHYKPYGAHRAYPASLCLSVNDAIVHGVPNEKEVILKEGDIASLDMGIIHKGLYTDSAITVPVGNVDKASMQLLRVTKEALFVGIEAAKNGNTVGDIGFAIQNFVKPYKYGIVEELAGHGVGYKVHEDPYVPNYGKAGDGPKLVPGMVIAIEPMLNIGTKRIILDADGFTYKTEDGSRSAHFEHTVVITDGDAEILTVE